MSNNPGEIFDFSALNKTIDISHLLESFKNTLNTVDSLLIKKFHKGHHASELIKEKATLIDQALSHAWESIFGGADDICLVAVGGYGREELHPGSDIDILILMHDDQFEKHGAGIEKFLTFLWDIGLDVGHSVRTIDDCITQSKDDITIITNLMESRLIFGNQDIYSKMVDVTAPDKIWPSKEFFKAKFEEQESRHQKYGGTAYNLEPNIKEAQGGLRDLQMINWVAKRHFGTDSLTDLVDVGFLEPDECKDLIAARDFIWDIRFALHALNKRRDDRLLFDHQKTIAEQLGYYDKPEALAVEQFMQDYYLTITELTRLNEMLLQLFQENILFPEDEPPRKLNTRFQVRKGFIETRNDKIFKRFPFSLMEIFLHTITDPDIKGIRADAIRQIRANLDLIDDKFRDDIRAKSLFMEILRQPVGVSHELVRMNSYGVLGAYLPEFQRITGMMQYDLFHAYTVDSHTLFVVRQLRRFGAENFASQYPFYSVVSKKLPKPELLYIAGLFHDIAKGQGGDHSEMGADDAYDFCIRHSLSEYDSRMVEWLVRNHLQMSMTAQRKDISLPEVIHEFAKLVGDQNHLNYLYLLTVADIMSTNPELFNNWRESLLRELYISTSSALRRGLSNIIDAAGLVKQTKEIALNKLKPENIHHMKIKATWKHLPDDYFLRFSPDEIAWHTKVVFTQKEQELPTIAIKKTSTRGGSEFFIYAKDRINMFAQICAAFEYLGLEIIDARIVTTDGGHALNSYLVVDGNGEPIEEKNKKDRIINHLRKVISNPQDAVASKSHRIPRQMKSFSTPTFINFNQDDKSGTTALEVYTADHPGLLSKIGKAFTECHIFLKNAKIITIGERAEDIFYVTDGDGNQITSETAQQHIQKSIEKYIEEG
mgnify:CR=1 FL=1